jgi:spore maturation protein CgeB
MSAPTLLVAGDFAWDQYEPALCRALRAQGAQVHELHALRLFGPGALLRRVQSNLVLGPGPLAAEAAFVALCARLRPAVALAWRAPWLGPLAIRLARRAGAGKVVLYNNDDPFGPDRHKRIWRAFRRAVPAADLVLAYRRQNVDELHAAGARAARLWRSAFDPALHRPLQLTDEERRRYGCDLVFVGHCEDDGRLELVDALVGSGLRLRLFGTGWDRFARGRAFAQETPVRPLRGDEYAKALCAASTALVFLSGRNRDTYTRRCFEIPACGALMLAPRTRELQELFREDEEALFFDGADELVAQARRAVADAGLRARVAKAGLARVWRDGHDLGSRAAELLRLCGLTGSPA